MSFSIPLSTDLSWFCNLATAERRSKHCRSSISGTLPWSCLVKGMLKTEPETTKWRTWRVQIQKGHYEHFHLLRETGQMPKTIKTSWQ